MQCGTSILHTRSYHKYNIQEGGVQVKLFQHFF